MTNAELKAERRVIYETRLGILGVEGAPTAEQNNLAAREADEHIEALLKAEREDAIGPLLALRDSLDK